ncbi:SDR family NAD(P)-dependent oxidoreductase [Cohnella silvisoli]|uniref:SDR family NAD(P)-dependent oxidoreductase n=1 Tax=Cohnella silvisoli TaxID=2873699 RepID=A0ABV1KRL2_9BACL|nr:SDR family NAD(P)-dependent oxidoreductase [Cohnella silvisoli]MCD9022445.1 SDR family NAD(P)-dependent oxidoreductase [Cohnella silvisoli]
MSKPLIVVVGAGPGVGLSVAKKFGAQEFRVVLVSRNKETLEQHAAGLRTEGIDARGVTADASDTASLKAAFEQIKRDHGSPDVLVYNAAALIPGTPLSLTEDRLLNEFKLNVAGALTSALQVAPDMIERKRGTILFTGGGLALHPMARVASLSIGKAGIRSLAFTLNEELAPHGVFVGTVTIGGYVKPGTFFDPDRIAEKYWQLYVEREETEIVFKED